jgi:hypothetical protein
MLFSLKLNNRILRKILTVTSVLLLALPNAATVLQAQDWDHINGRDKAHDPTGVWFLRLPIDPLQREFFLIVFHQGGTLTGDFQGESGFDPSAVPLPPTDPNYNNNVISGPLSGVWQKTGWNTFAGMVLDIEYHNAFNLPPNVSVFQFAKFQFTGRLSQSGDTMTFNALLTRYNPQGKRHPICLLMELAHAFPWKYCQTHLTPCPFLPFPKRLRLSSDGRIAEDDLAEL